MMEDGQNFADFDNMISGQNYLKHHMGSKRHGVDFLTPRSENKKKKWKYHDNLNGVENETIDDTEISSFISKKKKSSVVAEGSFQEDLSKSSVCEDSKLSEKKRKKLKTSFVAENRPSKDDSQKDQQDKSIVGENKKSQEQSSCVHELIQGEEGDVLTPNRKKKRKELIFSVEDQEVDGLTPQKKKKKKRELISSVDESIQDEDQEVDGLTPQKKKKKERELISFVDESIQDEDKEVEDLTPPKKKKKRKELISSVDESIQDEDQEVEGLTPPKKKKKRKELISCVDESIQDEDQEVDGLTPQKKKKKERELISFVDESIQDEDQEVDDSTPQKKNKSKRKDQIPSVEELIQYEDQEGDSLTTPKKRIKNDVLNNDLKYHQDEPHHNQDTSTNKSSKPCKKSNFTFSKECKEDDLLLGLTVAQLNESKRQDSHQKDYVNRNGLSESFKVKKNRKKKQLKERLSGRLLGSSQTQVSDLDQERNIKAQVKLKKRNSKSRRLLTLDRFQSDIPDAILQDGATSVVKASKSHKSLLKTENSESPNSNITQRNKKRTLSSTEEVIDLSDRGNDQSSLLRKGDQNTSFISHLAKPSVSLTEGTDFQENVAVANGIPKEDSDIEHDRNGKEVQNADVLEEQGECVHVKEKLSSSQDGASKEEEDAVVKVPSVQKTSPKMIPDPVKEFGSPSLRNSCTKETANNRRNTLSSSRLSISLIEPESGVSPITSTPTADTPRSGHKESKRRYTANHLKSSQIFTGSSEDLHSRMGPLNKNESCEKKTSVEVSEPVVTIDSEPESIRLSLESDDSGPYKSLGPSLRHDEFVNSEVGGGKEDLRSNISAQVVTNENCEQSDEENDFGTQVGSLEKGVDGSILHKMLPRKINLDATSVYYTTKSEPSFTCGVCDKEYVTRRNYDLHLKTHTTKRFKCEECEEAFYLRSHLTVHTALAHIYTAVNCDLCEEVFPSKRAFNGHLSRHVEKRHLCTICSKTFSYQGHLDEHLVYHKVTKSRSYNCEICPKVYKSRQNLHDHLRRLHQREWRCTVCDERFFFCRHLEEHMSTHSILRPYECTSCDKTFPRESDLEQHKWLHHLVKAKRRKRPYTPLAARLVELKGKVPPDILKKLLMEFSFAEEEKEETAKSFDTETDKEDTDELVIKKKSNKEHYRCSKCRKVHSGFDRLLCSRCILKKSKLSTSRR